MRDAQLFHLVPHSVHSRPSVRDRLLRKDGEELLAAVPIETVAASKMILDGPRDSAKRLVARQMAEAIVVRFELVDVAESGAVTMAVAGGAPLQRLEVLLEAAPVGDRRERVGARGDVLALGVESQRNVVGLERPARLDHARRDFETRLELCEVNGFRDVLV